MTGIEVDFEQNGVIGVLAQLLDPFRWFHEEDSGVMQAGNDQDGWVRQISHVFVRGIRLDVVIHVLVSQWIAGKCLA